VESVRVRNHLIAGANVESTQSDEQGVGSAVDAANVGCSEICGEFTLEGGNMAGQDVLTGEEHFLNVGEQELVVRAELGRVVVPRHFHLEIKASCGSWTASWLPLFIARWI